MDMLLLEEDSCIDDLRPFTSTRSVLDIRMGIFTLREKWEMMLGKEAFALVGSDTPGALPANILPTGQVIRYPWDIFRYNAEALATDFSLIAARGISQPIPASVQVINPEKIFIEEGARLQHCLLNASTGPIYIGRNAEIMEGSLI